MPPRKPSRLTAALTFGLVMVVCGVWPLTQFRGGFERVPDAVTAAVVAGMMAGVVATPRLRRSLADEDGVDAVATGCVAALGAYFCAGFVWGVLHLIREGEPIVTAFVGGLVFAPLGLLYFWVFLLCVFGGGVAGGLLWRTARRSTEHRGNDVL